MKMMNAFVESLIQQREREYRREIGLGPGGDFSDEVSGSLSGELDRTYFTNIQVRVLEDNPKSMISTKHTVVPDNKVPPDGSLDPATNKERRPKSQHSPPPAPPKPPSERSYSPRIQSKREKRGGKKEPKKSVNESNVQRWGGGSDHDASPTTMPKCPERRSVSPKRSPESLSS